jgi:hypothetical protein
MQNCSSKIKILLNPTSWKFCFVSMTTMWCNKTTSITCFRDRGDLMMTCNSYIFLFLPFWNSTNQRGPKRNDAARISEMIVAMLTHLAKKYRLELKHASYGEEHGRVIGHEGRAREDLVATGSIKIKKTPAYRVPAPLVWTLCTRYRCGIRYRQGTREAHHGCRRRPPRRRPSTMLSPESEGARRREDVWVDGWDGSRRSEKAHRDEHEGGGVEGAGWKEQATPAR